MTKEDKIKQLKELVILRTCALEYDYVPNSSQVENLQTNILDDGTIDDESLFKLLTEYEDESPFDITCLICDMIDKL